MDDREVRLHVAPPLELAEHRVVVLDELDHHRPMELLRVLGAEPGPPASMGDDLLDEVQVAEEELLGGQVVAGGGGEGGHGSSYGESMPRILYEVGRVADIGRLKRGPYREKT